MNDSDLKTGNHLSPSPKGKDVRDQQMFTHTHKYTQSESVTKKWQNCTSSRERGSREGRSAGACTHTHTHTHRIAHRLRAKIQQSSSIERKEMCLWSEIKREAVKEGKGALRQQGHSYRHTAHTLTFSLIGTESSTC